MYKQVLDSKKKAFDDTVIHVQNAFHSIRTGRANAALVENIYVDYYGVRSPLKQIASITVPESRLIVIQPWDRDTLTLIESAIKNSDLGVNPNNDGVSIRLNLPPLNEDRRRDLVKVVNQKAEEGKIAIRVIREDVIQEITALEKKGIITEDDKFRAKEELQKIVDSFNKKIDDLRVQKEQDVMTV